MIAKTWEEAAKLFREEFAHADLEWRSMIVTKDGKKCQLAPYVASRAIMERLDSVVGPQGWSDCYRETTIAGENGMLCSLTITIDGVSATKVDGAGARTTEPVKAAVSDALKRAAVKYGIGRYLYHLPSQWAHIEENGKYGTHIRVTKAKQFLGWARIPSLGSGETKIPGAAKGAEEAEPEKKPVKPTGSKRDDPETKEATIESIRTGLSYLANNKIDGFGTSKRRLASMKKHLGIDDVQRLAECSNKQLREYYAHLQQKAKDAPRVEPDDQSGEAGQAA